MQLRTPLLALATLWLLSGCANSDPGTGSQTLFVDATAESDGSSDGTRFTVIVRDRSTSGNLVDDAQVTMISDKGTEHTLTFFGFVGLGGYSKSGFAWESGWRLRILRGTDKLEGYVAAPGLTTILNPTGATSFDRSKGQSLLAQWRDESGRSAETVEVTLKQAKYDQLRSNDGGSFEIPAGTWSQATSSEELRVIRQTDTTLAGGVDGSVFKARTTAKVNFAVQ